MASSSLNPFAPPGDTTEFNHLPNSTNPVHLSFNDQRRTNHQGWDMPNHTSDIGTSSIGIGTAGVGTAGVGTANIGTANIGTGSIGTSVVIEGPLRVSHFTGTLPPQLSLAVAAIYRVIRFGLKCSTELHILMNDELEWSADVHTLHAAKVGSHCLFLTSSNYTSSREVADSKPVMPLSFPPESKQPIMPILLTFSSTGELERIQRCLVSFAPTVFCPSRQQSDVCTAGATDRSGDWCHLDGSDTTTVQTYFQYYGKMTNQMNMLQDSVRTELYRQSIFSNPADFKGKRVMDVGAGSGILSFFSAQAGAHVAYAVEASSMASTITKLAEENLEYGHRIKVINRTVEALDLHRDLDGERVDVLVSEPIGTFLFNERMIESYLYARDLFLVPGGRMYPNRCRLFLAPFSDQILYNDISSRCTFWNNQDFYGLNLSSVVERAVEEQFRQPVVDYIDPAAIVCQAWHQEDFDLETIDRASLANMEFNFSFPISSACVVHGIAGWFDVIFEGSERHVGFSTAPWCPPTHWYQIRFLLKHPIAANPGQVVSGTLRMAGNSQQSYFITVHAKLEGTNVTSESTVIDLKDPDYRYYSNPQASYVPVQSATVNTKIRSTPTSSTSAL